MVPLILGNPPYGVGCANQVEQRVMRIRNKDRKVRQRFRVQGQANEGMENDIEIAALFGV